METAFANDLRNPLLEVERAAFHLSIALVTLEPSTEYYYSEDMENMVNSRYSDKSGLHVTALFIDHAFQLFSTYFRSATQFQLEFDRLRQQQRTPACGAYHGSSRKYKLKVVDGSCFVGRKKMDATLDSIFALKSLLLHKSGYSHGRYMCLSKMSEDGDAVAYLTLLDNSVKMLEEAIAAGNAPSTQQSSSLTRPRKAWDELEEDTKRRRFNEWCRHAWYMGGATITDPATRVGLLRMALEEELKRVDEREGPRGAAAVVDEGADESVWSDQFREIMAAVLRKRRFTEEDKSLALELHDAAGTEKAGTLSLLLQSERYAGLPQRQLSRWIAARAGERERAALGTPPQETDSKRIKREFEREVWAQCILLKSEVVTLEEGEKDAVIGNVTYSRAILKDAGKAIQGLKKYSDVLQIERLKFSDGWATDLLKNQEFRLKKLTKEAKDPLSDDVIRKILSPSQREIILGGYPDDRVWNLDETAMRYLLGPCRIYMPSGQNRGEFISDEKSRVTLVVNVNSGGNFAPLMFVIKCSKGRSKKRVAGDESNTRVIKSMSLLEGFRPQDGWTEPILWTGQYTMKGGCQRICSVWYIQDMATGHVVTSQCNAWSDTARMLMYVDLILNRITQREGAGAEQHDTRHRARHNRGGHFLWMDSFSAHNNADVLESMRNAGVMAGFYPPNMTGDLQVLDLVVNRLLKQLVRRLREGELVAHFKKFKQDLIEKSEMWSAEKLLSAKFRPPKPLLHERILAMIKYVHELDQNASFRESVKRAFVKTGSYHDGNNNFVAYSSHKNADQGALPAKSPGVKWIDLSQGDDDDVEVDVDIDSDSDSDDDGSDGSSSEGDN